MKYVLYSTVLVSTLSKSGTNSAKINKTDRKSGLKHEFVSNISLKVIPKHKRHLRTTRLVEDTKLLTRLTRLTQSLKDGMIINE